MKQFMLVFVNKTLQTEAVINDFQIQGLKGRYTSIRSGGDLLNEIGGCAM